MYTKTLKLNGKNVIERDYKKEYEEYHSKPEQIENRAMRNKARREMEKEGKVSVGDGQEVDHIKPLSKGGTNNKRNLQVLPMKVNREKGNKY
jgi:5-methylcytosine-specific restriction endonuclease McrA